MTRTELIKRTEQTLISRRNALRTTLDGDRRMLRAQAEMGVGDEIDAAIATEQAEVHSQMASFETRELVQIEHALEKLRAGRYGRCETCERPIAPVRLKALPYATECIHCARRDERRGMAAPRAGGVNRIAAFASDDDAESQRDEAEYESIQ